MGESEQILIDVINPQLSLKADKTSPLIGETVVLTVEETPKMSDDLVSFWWEYSGEAGNHVHPNTPNSRAWSYKPKNDQPVTVTVHAKSKDSGEELASAALTLTARRIQVSGPRISGPAPVVWRPGVGLVAAERQVAEHQRVEFAATVNPAVGDLRYAWCVEPAGCTLHSPYSKETGVTCFATGGYTLTVTVKNADGEARQRRRSAQCQRLAGRRGLQPVRSAPVRHRTASPAITGLRPHCSATGPDSAG
ncbi:MAG: hypothetical protein ACUVQI_08865 [Thermochromatium sp.]